jgi:plasmid stabilization system protein ParE
VWTVEFAAAAEHDFELIFDHLLQSYQDFGDDFDIAYDRAAQRILAIQSSAQNLAKVPFQGTLRPDIFDGLRFVRHKKAVFWFVAHEDRKTVQILAIFYGGQDHIRHMLTRLLSDLPE